MEEVRQDRNVACPSSEAVPGVSPAEGGLLARKLTVHLTEQKVRVPLWQCDSKETMALCKDIVSRSCIYDN